MRWRWTRASRSSRAAPDPPTAAWRLPLAMPSAVIVRAHLPPGLAHLRQTHVTDAAEGVPAHVTLLYPFVPWDELDPSVGRMIASVAARHPAFDYTMTGPGRWPDTIYVAVEPVEPFVRLQGRSRRHLPRVSDLRRGEPLRVHPAHNHRRGARRGRRGHLRRRCLGRPPGGCPGGVARRHRRRRREMGPSVARPARSFGWERHRYNPAMKQMYHPSDLAAMDPLVLMKNLDHVRMTSRRLSYVLQQQVHLYTPEANEVREQIDRYVEAERQIEGEMARRRIRA
jgi:hypothetical protein